MSAIRSILKLDGIFDSAAMGIKGSYIPETDIPDLAGKSIFITGGTAGIGKETIIQLSKHKPSRIAFTGRNTKAAEAVLAEGRAISSSTKFTFIECDQSSLSSVQKAAKTYLAESNSLNILICNGGIMGPPAGLSKDGYEIQFAVNYLSHALLIKLLLPALERTTVENGARILLLSSLGFKFTIKGGIIFDGLKTNQANFGLGGKWTRYGQSKLAMVLLGKQLAKRHPNIVTVCIHPGTIHTGLITDLPTVERWWVKFATMGQEITLAEGAYNSCWAATTQDMKTLKSGGIYEPVAAPVSESEYSKDEKMGEKLWDWTYEELKNYE